MYVGLDFGTTNTSAAVYDGEKLQLLPIDQIAPSPSVLRSALFIARNGDLFIGRGAIDQFMERNVGREVDYRWVNIGETEMAYETGDIKQALFAQIDVNIPGRLFRSVKTALRDASMTHTNVFGREWKLEELVATMLRLIRTRIEESTGQPVTGMVIGRPVRYAEDERANQLAFQRMQKACELADLPNVTFLEEPTAAALAYAREAQREQNVLVFDFGGGTLDITIMHLDMQRHPTFMATDGVPIGGDIFDQRIVQGPILPHFGANVRLGARRLAFPAHILDNLGEWQSITELTQPKYQTILDEAARTADDPKPVLALRTLVRRNYGLTMYEMVERAKVKLSEQPEVALVMDVENIQFKQKLPRWDFDRLIGPDVRAVEACIRRTLDAAQIKPQQIDVVLRTGGSSRIPRFVDLLTTIFGADKLKEIDVFTSVAAGLGVAAWEHAAGRDIRLQDVV